MNLKSEAEALSLAMKEGAVDTALRARFIEFRTALYRRGIYDPVLGRFDTHTVTPSSASEVAGQLAQLAGSLT